MLFSAVLARATGKTRYSTKRCAGVARYEQPPLKHILASGIGPKSGNRHSPGPLQHLQSCYIRTLLPDTPVATDRPDIDQETVRSTARLARLAVDDAHLASYQEHFTRLLKFVEDVTRAPIDDVEPMAHPLDMVQRLRPDGVTEEDQRNELQATAPKAEDGFFLVPRVIE